mmetsp:Transcript_60595/g.131350  ORF Transcript_60595/g.131350 Transcript_60595/m.131350 type:complete len:224 (+) Transcript_60595:581-1252(+)
MLHGQSPHFQVQRVCLQPSPLHLEAFFASLILHERIVLPLTAVPRARALTLLLITPSVAPHLHAPAVAIVRFVRGRILRPQPSQSKVSLGRPWNSEAAGFPRWRLLLPEEVARRGARPSGLRTAESLGLTSLPTSRAAPRWTRASGNRCQYLWLRGLCGAWCWSRTRNHLLKLLQGERGLNSITHNRASRRWRRRARPSKHIGSAEDTPRHDAVSIEEGISER